MGSFLKNIHPLLRRTKGKDEHQNTNYAILNAIDTILNDAEKDTLDARVQSTLHTAKEKYLDHWGRWFGLSRRTDEDDKTYRKRIISRVDVPRGTKNAIISAVKDALGDPYVKVLIYEPWQNMFVLNHSKLNGEDSLMGEFYNIGVIEVTVGTRYHEDLFKIIDDFKPAGVTVHIKLDLSLGSDDPNALPETLPALNISAYRSEKVASRMFGARDELRGTLSILDPVPNLAGDLFTTNFSNMNQDDRLTGPNTGLSHLHLVTYGGNFYPHGGVQLTDVLRNTTEVASYDPIKPNVSKGLYTYFTMNVDEGLYNNHPYKMIKKTRKAYESYLQDSWVTVKLKSGKQGQVAILQAYNFTERTWEDLSHKTVRDSKAIVNTQIKNPGSLLSNQRYIILRVRGLDEVTYEDVTLTYVADATNIGNVKRKSALSFYGKPPGTMSMDELTGLVVNNKEIPDGYLYIER